MIYTASNTALIGKPVKVFVNANEVKRAIFADTEKGIVHFCPHPIRLKKRTRDEIYSRTLKGQVTVEPIKG